MATRSDECESLGDRLAVGSIALGMRLAMFLVDATEPVLALLGCSLVNWRSSYKKVCSACSDFQERRSRPESDDGGDSIAEPALPPWVDDWRVHMEATDCPAMPASARWLALNILKTSADGRLKIMQRLDQQPEILQV